MKKLSNVRIITIGIAIVITMIMGIFSACDLMTLSIPEYLEETLTLINNEPIGEEKPNDEEKPGDEEDPGDEDEPGNPDPVPLSITINGIPETENGKSASIWVYSGGDDLFNGDITKLIASGSAIVADGKGTVSMKKPDDTDFYSTTTVHAIAIHFDSGKRYVYTDGASLSSLANEAGIYLNTNYNSLPLTTLPADVSFNFTKFVPLELLPIFSIEEDWNFTQGSDSISEGETVTLTITFDDNDEDSDYVLIPRLERWVDNDTSEEIFEYYEGYNDEPPLANDAIPNEKTITVRLSDLPLYENNLHLRLKKENSNPAIYYPISQKGAFDDEIIKDYYELPVITVEADKAPLPPPRQPHIIAIIPTNESDTFDMYWYLEGKDSSNSEVEDFKIQIENAENTFTTANWGTGSGTDEDPYITHFEYPDSINVDDEITLHVFNEDGVTPSSDTDIPEDKNLTVTVFQNPEFQWDAENTRISTTLDNVFDNVLARYSNVNIIVTDSIETEGGHKIGENRTVSIEAGTNNLSITRTPSTGTDGAQFGLFYVDGGDLTLGTGNTYNPVLTLNGTTGSAPVMYLNAGNLTLKDGATITGNTNSSDGGGVYVAGGTFTMEGGEISGNIANYNGGFDGGGGVYVAGGEFKMSNGSISGNKANIGTGGGVYFKGVSFEMTGGYIQDNEAASEGGGVYLGGGDFNMLGGTIGQDDNGGAPNNSHDGAGVYVSGGKFIMNVGSTIAKNVASNNGGGVYVNNPFTISEGTISDNSAANGGGVYLASTEFKMLDDSKITQNIATASGGGVHVAGGTFYFIDGSITLNSAAQGGGVFHSDQETTNTGGEGNFQYDEYANLGNINNNTGGDIYQPIYDEEYSEITMANLEGYLAQDTLVGSQASPAPIDLNGINITENWNAIKTIITESGKYVDLDISECTFTENTIEGSLFYECKFLTSIDLPDSVTTMGARAFQFCTNLTSIDFPADLTTIHGSAFEECDSLTNVIIPETVTSMGDHVFFKCDLLESVSIPNSVASMGDSVFAQCPELKSVIIDIPVGTEGVDLTGIQYATFASCPKLTSVEFMKSGIVIENTNAFDGNLKTVYENAYPIGGAGTYKKTGDTWAKQLL